MLWCLASPGSEAATAKKVTTGKPSRPAARSRQTRPTLSLDRLPLVEIENAHQGLEPFLAALEALEDPARSSAVTPVRVLHFGDSHVTADFWSGELRAALQARFGSAGTGYVMPGRPWKYFRHSLAKSLGGGWTVHGLEHEHRVDFLGLSGTSLTARPRARQAGVLTVASDFEIQVGLPDGEGCVRVLLDGEQVFFGELGLEGSGVAQEPPGTGSQKAVAVARPLDHEVTAPSPGVMPGVSSVVGQCQALAFIRNATPLALTEHLVEVEASCGGNPVILGMDFASPGAGVILDTLGINGAELERLGRFQPGLRAALLEHSDPRLIIVSYGANDMTSDTFTREGYRDATRAILAGLRRDAPGAAILVTGPFDRSARRKGPRRELVKANEGLIVAALREAALAEGCAFWDARAAMGGENAITTWRAAGLAQRDLVHLTQAGYTKLGRVLFERLMAAYDEYRATHPGEPDAGSRTADPGPPAPGGAGG